MSPESPEMDRDCETTRSKEVHRETQRDEERERPTTLIRSGKHRARADPQAFARLGQTAHLRRSGRGQAGCPGLFRTAKRARAVDAEAAGNGGRGTGHR
jgi:hypothetical protein